MIAYFKLLDLLNRKNIRKEEFRKKIGISSGTMAKIGKNEYVALEVIDKICKYLNCQPGDIIEYIETEEKTSNEIWGEQIELIKKPKKGILKESLKNGLAFGDTAAKELLEK